MAAIRGMCRDGGYEEMVMVAVARYYYCLFLRGS